ncbi:MAG: VWA domain-containing protein [bacterium]
MKPACKTILLKRILLLGILLVSNIDLFGQGFLISEGVNRALVCRMLEHEVDVNAVGERATLEVRHKFQNQTNHPIVSRFYFAFSPADEISECRLEAEQGTIAGELLNSESTSEITANMMRFDVAPVLLNHIHDKLFVSNSLTLQAGDKLELTFRYRHKMTRDRGLFKFIYPLRAIYPYQDLHTETFATSQALKIHLHSPIPIKNVYSPTHPVSVIRKNDLEAAVASQFARSHFNEVFVLYFSQSQADFGIDLVTQKTNTEDGYFLILISPSVKIPNYKILKKDIVFVLDVSESMSGLKLKQAKEALKFCMENLNNDDNFNIITFSSETTLFKNKLVEAGRYKKPALDFINQMEAGGGTNINEALLTVLDMKGTGVHSKIIVFITDGRPTVGVKDVKQIRNNARRLNENRYQIFNFGVGYHVNTHLLDGIAQDNHAVAEYIEPGQNIELAISRFYNYISKPVLSFLELDIAGVEIYDTFPKQLPHIFKGSQLAILGRYKLPGVAQVNLSGQLFNERKTYRYQITFPNKTLEHDYLPRLWAARKMGYLLQQIQLRDKPDSKELQLAEVVRLSKKFAIEMPGKASLTILRNEHDVAENHKSKSHNVTRNLNDLFAFQFETGERAVALSKGIRRLQDAESIIQGPSNHFRYVLGKSFLLDQTNFWHDLAYDGKSETVDLKYGSQAYLQLLTTFPKVRPFLALGRKVLFELNGRFVKISGAGLEKLEQKYLDQWRYSLPN